jgi:hypothetical protein
MDAGTVAPLRLDTDINLAHQTTIRKSFPRPWRQWPRSVVKCTTKRWRTWPVRAGRTTGPGARWDAADRARLDLKVDDAAEIFPAAHVLVAFIEAFERVAPSNQLAQLQTALSVQLQ